MKGILITAGAALLVAVPAAMGLVGNTSFSQSVPVRVPAQARVLYDDQGGQSATHTSEPPTSTTLPGDDHGGQRPTPATPLGKVLSDNAPGKGQIGGDSGKTGGSDASAGHR
jgi:hypothetical protein